MNTLVEIKGRYYQQIRMDRFDKSSPCAECDILKNSTLGISDCVIYSDIVGGINCESD